VLRRSIWSTREAEPTLAAYIARSPAASWNFHTHLLVSVNSRVVPDIERVRGFVLLGTPNRRLSIEARVRHSKQGATLTITACAKSAHCTARSQLSSWLPTAENAKPSRRSECRCCWHIRLAPRRNHMFAFATKRPVSASHQSSFDTLALNQGPCRKVEHPQVILSNL
jgi:hypothetical protein